MCVTFQNKKSCKNVFVYAIKVGIGISNFGPGNFSEDLPISLLEDDGKPSRYQIPRIKITGTINTGWPSFDDKNDTTEAIELPGGSGRAVLTLTNTGTSEMYVGEWQDSDISEKTANIFANTCRNTKLRVGDRCTVDISLPSKARINSWIVPLDHERSSAAIHLIQNNGKLISEVQQ